MEKFFKYVKSNTKYAAKSVFHNFKEYLPFFAALFIIQCIFFTIFITTATNAKNTEEKLYQQFDYDVVISGLDYNQTLVPERQLYIQSFMKNRMFESYRIEQAPEIEGGDYRIYVTMREGEDLDFFIERYINEPLNSPDNIRVTTSPLYTYKSSSLLSESPSLLIWALLCVISAGAIAAIYSVRINNQKFLYGIYITFGANLKKLISTSVFEMMLLGCLSFIPSAIITYLFTFISYMSFDITPVFNIRILLYVLLSIFIIAITGSYFPMKLVSKKTPLSLISSQDNSNFASSPTRSVNMLGKIFPRNYEFLSVWRFRKYYVKLVLSSVIFTSIFVCGFYIADIHKTTVEEPIKEYVVFNESNSGKAEQMKDINTIYDTISSKNGVERVSWNVDTPASLINSFMIVSKDNLHNTSGLYASTANSQAQSEEMQKYYQKLQKDNYTNVINSFKYSAFNEKILDNIEKEYKITGDLNSILNQKNTVIVSEDIFNTQRIDFEVGDKIILAKHTEALAEYGGDYFDTVAVLNHLINDHTYEFYEFTVGAIIENYGDTEGYFTVAFNEADYQKITGQSYTPSEIDVYLSANITAETLDELNGDMNAIFYEKGEDYSLTRTYETVSRSIKLQSNNRFFMLFISSLVLIMSPILWFFTQSAFFAKREKELYVLRAYGAREKNISRIFTYSGITVSIVGFFVATLMSLPASYLIFKIMSNWLPSLGMIEGVTYMRFALSPISILVCALISGLSGLLSAVIPYKLTLRKSKKSSDKNNYKGSEIDGRI